MAGGRPTIYNNDILVRALTYLQNYEKEGDLFPSIAGLAVCLKISRSTVNKWATEEDKKEFSDILEDMLSMQERIIVNKSMKGDFNSNIAKLVLGKHGYHDKQEHLGKDGGALAINLIKYDSSEPESVNEKKHN